MAILTQNRDVVVKQPIAIEGGYVLNYPVAASQTIRQGSLVNLDAGGDLQVIPVATSTADCIGLAREKCDNSSGADADIKCEVLVGGVIEHTLASVAKTDIGSPVYASDDNTLTLTSTNNSLVGQVIHVSGTNLALVKMQYPGMPA